MKEMPSVFNWNFDLHVPRLTGTSLSEFWFCFILMNGIFLLVYSLRYSYYSRRVTWLVFLLFCLYAFWDTDYFSFANNFYKGLDNFRDPIYKFISLLSFGSYIIFRLWIWGISLLLVYLTTKRYELNVNIMCYVFTLFYMLTFSYARASLGMALFFWGFSYMTIHDTTPFKKIIIIVTSFILSFMAHRSMLVLIIISPLSLLKLTKKSIIMIAMFFPLIIITTKFILSDVIVDLFTENSSEFAINSKGFFNLKTTMSFNWKWELITTLRYWSFYITMIYAIYKFYFKEDIENCPKEMSAILTISMFVVIIAVAILIISGNKLLGLWVIGYRLLYMGGIPLCLLLTYMNQTQLLSDRGLNRLLLIPLLYGEYFLAGKILTLQFLK